MKPAVAPKEKERLDTGEQEINVRAEDVNRDASTLEVEDLADLNKPEGGEAEVEEEVDEKELMGQLGFDHEKSWEDNVTALRADAELGANFKKLQPLLDQKGFDVEDLIDLLSKPAEEPKAAPSAAAEKSPDVDKYLADFLNQYRAEDQPGMKKLLEGILGHPSLKFKTYDSEIDNLAGAIYRRDQKDWYREFKSDYESQKDASGNPRKLTATFNELKKIVDDNAERLIKRYQRDGINPMAYANRIATADKGDPKPPAGTNGAGTGMDRAKGAERPSGATAMETQIKRPKTDAEWSALIKKVGSKKATDILNKMR